MRRVVIAITVAMALTWVASAQDAGELWRNLYDAAVGYLDSLVEVDPATVVIGPQTRLWDIGDLSSQHALEAALQALVDAGLVGFADDQVVGKDGTRYVWPVPDASWQDYAAEVGPNGRRVFAVEEGP